MSGKIIGIVILVIVAFGLFVPLGSSGSNGDSSIAVTYGETTYNNHEYKQMVDEYFEKNGNVNLNDTDEKVITSNDVNRISSGISQRTYNSNQIFSCAMVDLNGNNNIKIDVDPKITTVTPSMYKSALDSAGIKKGHVVVTSPVTATGESALAGIMKAYETATGQLIPEEVKNTFAEVFEGFVGSKVEPFALLATQVTKGTNYIFAATVTPVTKEPKTKFAIVTVNALEKSVTFSDPLHAELKNGLGYAFNW
jgi:uncharacterized protein YpuA (DUF1002 family)